MARPLRIEFPDALYHVTSRGNERRAIFRTNQDRKTFLDFLGQAAKRFGWSITAYVLMTNHFHLVIQTPKPNLSLGMQWLNGTYVGWFNRIHKRCGHLYQGRFKARLVQKELYFAEVLRYVVLNPVRAHMVERPEDFKWSSYRASAGYEDAPEWLDLKSLLEFFHPEFDEARTNYKDFVCARVDGEEPLWSKLTNQIFLGTEEWTRNMRKTVETKPRSTDHPRAQRAVGRPKMYQIVDAVGKAAGTSAAWIRETRGNALRRLAAWIGWHEGLITLRSIAAGLRLRSEGHISNLIRRCDREFGSDEALLKYLDVALVTLRA
jgi:putative transposase